MRNTLLYLKSNASTFNTDINFNRWLLTNPIQARKDELLTIQVIEAEFPITYYNVDATNNVFECVVITDDVDDGASNEDHTETYTLTLETRNYTAAQLAATIDAIGDKTHSTLNCAYDKKTGKMILTATSTTAEPSDSSTKITIGANSTCNRLIGFSVGQTKTQPNTGNTALPMEGDNIVDMNRTNNIYIETDLMLDSRDTDGNRSGILAKVQQNKKFLDVCHYQTGHNLPLELDRKDTYLDHIDLRILDDNNIPIDFNGDNNYSITLLFSYIKKEKLLLGEEVEGVETLPIIDNINTGDSCDEYSDNEI
tara:strand:+ start:949 stop:1878 length:930 start_codon:yes stop_codon:yes gene_type:complete